MSSQFDLPEKLKKLEINKFMLSNKTETNEETKQDSDLTQNPFYFDFVTTSDSRQVRFSNCRNRRLRRKSEGESLDPSELLKGDIPGVHRQKFKKYSKAILRDPVLTPCIRKSFPGASCSSCRHHMPAGSSALIESFRKIKANKQTTPSPGNDRILDSKTNFEQQRLIANFTPKQAELRNSTSNIYDETIVPNFNSITPISQIPPEQNPATAPRSSTSCAQQAGGNVTTGGGAGTCDDVTIDELASYFDTLVHIPKKMSSMAEMMYT